MDRFIVENGWREKDTGKDCSSGTTGVNMKEIGIKIILGEKGN